MTDPRRRLIEVIRERGHLRLEEPVQLASGDWSRHFVDVNKALVDRGEFGRKLFESEGIPFGALLTYDHLGIPAVGSESGIPAAAG